MSKKMKITALILTIIVFTTTMGFSSSDSEEDIVEELITERINAMDLYYESQINEFEAKERLRAVENGTLLDEDIDNLHTYFRTDIEEIKEFDFQDIEITSSDEDVICAQVKLGWNIEGTDGKEILSCSYSVICENDGSGFKLVQFYG